jgi:hypothetical protein
MSHLNDVNDTAARTVVRAREQGRLLRSTLLVVGYASNAAHEPKMTLPLSISAHPRWFALST